MPQHSRARLIGGVALLGCIAICLMIGTALPTTDVDAETNTPDPWTMSDAGRTSLRRPPRHRFAQQDASADRPDRLRRLLSARDAFVTAFLSALQADSSYARYLSCQSDCAELLNAAYWVAWADVVGMLDDDRFGVGVEITDLGESEVHERLEEILASSTGDVERIATLGLLERSVGIRERELAADAYSELANRTDLEAKLLLTRHRVVAVTHSSLTSQLVEVSRRHRSRAIQYAAVLALGHPTTATEFDQIVADRLEAGTADSAVLRRVTAALIRCGPACEVTLERLVTSPELAERMAAYDAIIHATGPYAELIRRRLVGWIAATEPESVDEEAERARALRAD